MQDYREAATADSNTFGRFVGKVRTLEEVQQILLDIERGFSISDRSVSWVRVDRTNDNRAWTISYGTDYPKA